MPDMNYAWCFDHGVLHRFSPAEGPWCTGTWVQLPGVSEDLALEAKERQYGEARFFDQLTLEQQVMLVEARS
ncbi:hypothetical protein ACIGO7_37760 [Streptomyces virginiae]|uniref:hypothetical protein n=1 Tax=Streptomyces virginiae TaxID=1961 RepID=UPI0037D0C1C6